MYYKTQDLVFNYSLRSKLFSWTEVFGLTGKFPSEILKGNSGKKFNQTDPLWLYTQSAKNYSFDLEILLKNYSQSAKFVLDKNFYGISTKFNTSKLKGVWANYLANKEWYFRQKKIAKLSSWIESIPGITNIYLVGSSALELAQKNSDIDLAIQCRKGFCLPVRLYVKVLLKIFNVDVHSFSLGLWGSYKKKVDPSYENLAIRNFKNRSGLKIDAGLFFEDFNQVEKYFTKDIRQLWLWKGLKLNLNDFTNPDFGCCNYYSSSNKYLNYPTTLLFYSILPAMYIVSLFQLILYKFITKPNLNRPVKFNFISFYPLFHEEKYIDYNK